MNGKLYIGQTWEPIKTRFIKHKSPSQKKCRKLFNAFNKYGRNNFSIRFITLAHTQEIADYWERYFINYYDSIVNGYNIKDGGSKGKPSAETRRKMSDAQKGKIISIETRQKMSDAKMGKKASNETKRKLSEAHMGNTVMLGKKLSEETKQKMSISGKGKVMSDETRRKISDALKGKPFSEEHKKKIADTKRNKRKNDN
jgi:group I intron endonuclease